MRRQRVILAAAGVVGLAALMTIGLGVWSSVFSRVAHAQTSRMRFEEAPAESVKAFEERRDRRERRASSSTALPAAPDAPNPPDEPEAPKPPDAPSSGDIVRIGSDIHVDKDQVVD